MRNSDKLRNDPRWRVFVVVVVVSVLGLGAAWWWQGRPSLQGESGTPGAAAGTLLDNSSGAIVAIYGNEPGGGTELLYLQPNATLVADDSTTFVDHEMWWYDSSLYSLVATLTGDVTIDGKPHEVGLQVDIRTAELQVLVEYFNQHLAESLETSRSLLETNKGLLELVRNQARSSLAATKLPTPTFTVESGVSSADPDVAAAWRKGMPAWQAQEGITGTPVTSRSYVYQFVCSSYMLQANDLPDLTGQVTDALPSALKPYVTLSIQDHAVLPVQTQEPCAIGPQPRADEIDVIYPPPAGQFCRQRQDTEVGPPPSSSSC